MAGGKRPPREAIFTAGEQEKFVTLQVPKRLFNDGEVGRTELVVETMVLQQAGPSMPPAELQLASSGP